MSLPKLASSFTFVFLLAGLDLPAWSVTNATVLPHQGPKMGQDVGISDKWLAAGEAEQVDLFQLVAGAWVYKQSLYPPAADQAVPGYDFGVSVAIDGDTLVVGSTISSIDPAGVSVFRLNGALWNTNPEQVLPEIG